MIRVLLASLVFSTSLATGQTQNSQEGSLNTSNVDSTVSSNNNTEDRSVSNTYNGAGSSSDMPVYSAVAPSYMSNGIETCLQGSGSSLQTGILGITRGGYATDEDCNRRRDARLLNELGMTVAAIARMCGDEDIWRSMFLSGTPCPIQQQGRLVVGKSAFLLMKLNPSLYIPEYGDVRMVRRALITDAPPEPRFTDTQLWYNAILDIGIESDEEQIDDIESVSSRFRSSLD